MLAFFHAPQLSKASFRRMSSSFYSSLSRLGYLVLPKAFPTQIVDLCWPFFMPPNFRKQAFVVVLHEKSLLRLSEEALYRGPERIRTAVGAFAELCLATRPQDLF